jgi:hypothetical protein
MTCTPIDSHSKVGLQGIISVDNDLPCRYFICTRGRSLLVTSWLAVKTLLVHIVRSA